MRKFTQIKNVQDFEVLTDTGYQPIQSSNMTVPYQVYLLKTDNYQLECADDHIVFDQHGAEVFVKDLVIGDLIHTQTGLDKVILVKSIGIEEPMYDLSLPEGTDHRYYTNGILSHNTTVLLEMLYLVQKFQDKKVLFISAEMNRLDMARYLKRFPHWGQMPILFMSDYSDSNPAQVIEQTLNQGWDLVLTDSYTEVNDTVKEECSWTRGKAEKWFLDLMDNHNKGNNDLKKYTTFVTILQLSKGGSFVGSNKLKHMTTGMMHIDFLGGENSDQRFIEFSKNRVGTVGKKLFFNMKNGVHFDEARYSRELWADEQLASENARLEHEENAFDKIFGKMTADQVEVAE